jgi:hypothetical protein
MNIIRAAVGRLRNSTTVGSKSGIAAVNSPAAPIAASCCRIANSSATRSP